MKLVCLRGILHPTFLAHPRGQVPAKALSATLYAFPRYPQLSILDHELIYDLEWCVAFSLRADCSLGCEGLEPHSHRGPAYLESARELRSSASRNPILRFCNHVGASQNAFSREASRTVTGSCTMTSVARRKHLKIHRSIGRSRVSKFTSCNDNEDGIPGLRTRAIMVRVNGTMGS